MTATLIIGDVLDVLRSMPDDSVDSIIMSPPYFRQRSYLPADHPDKARELGQERTPGEFLENLLIVMDALWPVMTADATFWVNLGDKHAGSGGAGGDYAEGGSREGQPKYGKVPGVKRSNRRDQAPVYANYGRTRSKVEGWPLEQSVCWLPPLFGASLAYGRNVLTGAEHREWVTRPPVTWCKPSPPVGKLTRTFRTATELIIYGGKHQGHFFDLDAVRYDPPPENDRKTWMATDRSDPVTGRARFTQRTVNPNGAPPSNWWVVGSGSGYDGAHFATYPTDLLIRPVLAGCPERVCGTCGKPSVRLSEESWDLDETRPQKRRAMELARAAGLTVEHFRAIRAKGITDAGKAQTTQDGNGRNSAEVERLAGEAKAALGGYYREFTYGNTKAAGWSDCGHADWRPGRILDPFGGSGTTAVVATGHGRDCTLIDLDERNADLCRQRVGMFLTVEHHISAVVA